MKPQRRGSFRHRTVLGLHVFNALSAIGGGIALMIGLIDVPAWVTRTGFPDLYFPGVILMAVVGGSSAVAALAAPKKLVGWQLASILAGVVMIMWIVGEVVSIRGFHFLQVVYLLTGGTVIWLTSADDEPLAT